MAALADGGQELGGLVQQILETQKEFEDLGKKQQRGQVEIVMIAKFHNQITVNIICMFDIDRNESLGWLTLPNEERGKQPNVKLTS